jgi:hypothetical protein
MADAPLLLKQEQWLVGDEIAERTDDRRAPFTLALAARLRRPVDHDAIRRTLEQLARRHAALRSAFVRAPQPDRAIGLREFALDKRTTAPLYRHVVHDVVELPFEVVCLDDVAEGHRRDAWNQAGRRVFMALFDAAAPPLARAALIDVDRESSDLLIVIHHLIADRESLQVLARDVRAWYAFYAGHGPHPDLPPPLDYPEALRRLAAASEAERQRATDYWLRRWSITPTEPASWETPPVTPDPARADASAGAYGRRRTMEVLHLDEHVFALARDCAVRQRTTLYVVCLSAFALALSRWLDTPTVAVWISVDNRWRAGDGELVAWTANSHVVAIEVLPDATGIGLLRQVRKVVLETIEHGHIPGVEVTRRTGQPPPQSRPWVMFDLFRVVGAPDGPARDDSRGLVSFPETPPGVSFTLGDLVLHLYVQGTRARCIAGFPSNGWASSAAVQPMLRAYASTLAALSTDPERPVTALYPQVDDVGRWWRSRR